MPINADNKSIEELVDEELHNNNLATVEEVPVNADKESGRG